MICGMANAMVYAESMAYAFAEYEWDISDAEYVDRWWMYYRKHFTRFYQTCTRRSAWA